MKLIDNDSFQTKTSFPPISDEETTILILGSLPGEKSLELQEYYGHGRNRFWKIIASITQNELPDSYFKKKELLLKNSIGVWDVVSNATRIGSLDTAIKNVVPNNLEHFIATHKNLKIIGFNGSKSQALHDKYFARKKEIKYFLLPSSSPANARINFDDICKIWSQLFI
jgi:hypoxanthine-DNA glycosylase